MRRFTRFHYCAALAVGLVSSHTFAGPLGSAASDAFRRLPQSAPPTSASTGEPAPAPVAATVAPTAPADQANATTSPSTSSNDAPDSSTYSSSFKFVVPNDQGVVYITPGSSPQSVPEPGVLALLGVGGVGLVLARRRRKQ